MNNCGRSLRIILAEKDPEGTFLIKEMLKETGVEFSITVAENGQKALDFLNRTKGIEDGRIDLVILDLDLPRIDGFEVLSYVRSMHRLRDIPVAVMTRSFDVGDEKKARSLGADHYFARPSSNDEFKATAAWLKDALLERQRTVSGKCSAI